MCVCVRYTVNNKAISTVGPVCISRWIQQLSTTGGLQNDICACTSSLNGRADCIPEGLFFFSFSGWGETESTWYVAHCWPIVPAPDDRWWWLWSSRSNEDWQGKPKYSEKTCRSDTLSTTNPTWPDLGSNPGCRGGKPATKRLSYGTAYLRALQPVKCTEIPRSTLSPGALKTNDEQDVRWTVIFLFNLWAMDFI
jgi:hypothetical protein